MKHRAEWYSGMIAGTRSKQSNLTPPETQVRFLLQPQSLFQTYNTMKQKHTNSRKARRASMFHKMGAVGIPSKVRVAKRDALFGRKTPKTFGEQLKYIQKILVRRDQFGNPIYKHVRHSVQD